MPKPILLAIDDDTSVLEAVVQDLRRQYGQFYRILRAASGAAALDICRQLKERNETVALFLSDQRMPGMTGVEFLQQVIPLFPDAKRVLLTAYADTDAAIRAINSAKIHYYLNKPWDPPEEKLYPVLNDLLESWQQGYKPPFEGIRVIGTRWSPLDHAVRDFLSRNRIPYMSLDPEHAPDALALLQHKGIDDAKLPVVLFGDGTALVQPTTTELADKAGLRTQAQQEFYDVVIVGAGPAGLAAGVYGASEGLRTLIVESDRPRRPGRLQLPHRKLPRLPRRPQRRGARQARLPPGQPPRRRVPHPAASPASAPRTATTSSSMADGSEITCHVCLIATGVSYCMLDVPGADRFTGAGVYYGAAQNQAPSCAGETVYIVGGANSAGQAAMHFARYAAEVHILVRGDSLEQGMSKYLVDQIEATPNIIVETCTEVVSMSGDNRLECITLTGPRGQESRPANSLFIFIGAAPKTDWLPAEIIRDPKGFILAGPDLKARNHWPATLGRDPYLLETSVPGIFVAGDARHGSVKRCASAVGEGSIAIQFVHQYLATL